MPAGSGLRRPLPAMTGRAVAGLRATGSVVAAIGLVAAVAGLAVAQPVTTPVLFGLGMALLALGLGAGAVSQVRRRRAGGVAGYTGPNPVLVFAAGTAAALGAQSLVVLVLGSTELRDVLVLVVSSGTTAAGALAAIAILVVHPGALSWTDMGLRRTTAGRGSPISDLLVGILLAVPTLLLAGVIAIVLVGILGVEPEPVLPIGPDPAVLATSLVVAALVAPVWEELFFRGFATTAWARGSGPRSAIVRGAVFFALVHVLTMISGDVGTAARIGLVAFLVRLPVGLVLGWIYLRRRSLLAPIALHATYNALPILLYAASSTALPGA